MMNYETVVKALLVVPVGEPIFSEMATTVSIDDEAAGAFVVVEQEGNTEKVGKINIDPHEWPSLRDAIERQIAVCEHLNATPTAKPPQSE